MALLPGYRWLQIGEIIPHGPCRPGAYGGTLCRSKWAGSRCVVTETYMVPISKPRQTKSYTPPETSLEAHKSQKDKAPVDASKILSYIIREDRPKGATCDEIEVALSLSHQTASARVRDLFKAGSIRDSGIRRNTRTGRKAAVWEAVLP